MSLRQRLLLLVLGGVVLVWTGVAAFTYYDARHELNELLEEHPAQSASFLGMPPTTVSSHDDDDEDDASELAEMRDELALRITGNLLWPLWIALPVLAGLLWWVIEASLRPLARLTQAVASRQPDMLTPLEVAAPPEVMPLIERLNHLFARIGTLIENERRFTADAAHELRTPMAAIKAQVQVAQGAATPEERSCALDKAVQGCNRATHLIEQLLTLARLESVDAAALQPCALRTLAAEVIADAAPAAVAAGVELELLEGESVTVNALPALLQVLLRNLLDNAIRYTPAGTQVKVSVGRQGGKVFLRVADNGPGLPVEEREKISRRFYRVLGTASSGSGLGLSIVQRITSIHQASVTIGAGHSGQGLSVTIVF